MTKLKSDSSHGSSTTRCRLVRPSRIGMAARIVVSLCMVSLATLAARAGGAWLIPAFGAAALGILIALAALFRQPGCEVNLIWQRVLGKAPIDCFLFGPIGRWEQNFDLASARTAWPALSQAGMARSSSMARPGGLCVSCSTALASLHQTDGNRTAW